MKKIFVTESQFQKLVKEALGKSNINENFASNAVKKAVMSNGGIDSYDKDEGSPVGWESKYDYRLHNLPGIIDKLTDEDLVYRALHLDEFSEVLHVRCKNGTVLTIPISEEEYNEADRKHDERFNYSKYDDGKYYYQPESDKYNV